MKEDCRPMKRIFVPIWLCQVAKAERSYSTCCWPDYVLLTLMAYMYSLTSVPPGIKVTIEH